MSFVAQAACSLGSTPDGKTRYTLQIAACSYHVIASFKLVDVMGEKYVFSDIQKVRSTRDAHEHRFFGNLAEWAKAKGVPRGDYYDTPSLIKAADLNAWFCDRIPGGEEAWAVWCKLTGLDQDEEIAPWIAARDEAKRVCEDMIRMEVDESYGSF